MRWLIIIVVCLGLACSKKEAPPPAEEAPAAETKTTGAGGSETAATVELPPELQAAAPPLEDPPSLKLLEPGDKPLRELRLKLKPDFEQTISMKVEFDITATFTVGGFALSAPSRTTIYKITLKAKELMPGGALHVAFRVDEVNAEYPETAERRHVERLKTAVASMKRAKGTYSLDARGRITDVKVHAGSGAIREAHDMADNLAWALYQMGPSFPEEPLGVGARWTAHRGLQQSGMHVNQLSTMELTKLEGTAVDIEKEHRQSAARQTFQNPGTAQPLELVGLITEGSGKVSWNLTELAPRSASVKSVVQKQVVQEFEKEGRKADTLVTTSRALTIPGE